MRARFETILAAAVALCVGVAAGWFAARAWGKGECENVEVCKYGNVETANAGRARSPSAPNENSKPRRKALIRSSADAEVQKRILENKISYLEKCIAAAKRGDAQPAENNHVTNAEIIERLKKLPTEDERWTELMRLDREISKSLTLGELKQVCPEYIVRDDAKLLDEVDKMTKVAARRIGILDAFDPSGLNEEEGKVHEEYMEFFEELIGVYANLIDQHDSTTVGEVWDRVGKLISTSQRGAYLHKKEREMLFAQVVKGFEVPDGDAAELRAVLDGVWAATSTGYFEKKD